MTNSSIGKFSAEFLLKAKRLRLISVEGVPFTRMIFIGNKSKSFAKAINFSSSLKGMITAKIPFSESNKSAASTKSSKGKASEKRAKSRCSFPDW
ncbi:hypothetical protein D3C72_2164420 [compost metagenome]